MEQPIDFTPDETRPAPVRMDGLRLALFTDTYLPQMNGVSRTLARLVEAMERRGGSVHVVTPDDPGAAGLLDPRVTRVPSTAFWAYPQLRLSLPAPRRLEAHLRAFRPHLVHVATPFGVGLAGRRLAGRLRVPLVSSYHTSFTQYARYYGLGALEAPGWRFLRWFHEGTLRTYCPTDAVRRELGAHGFTRTALWSRGVETERFSPTARTRAMRVRMGASNDATVVIAYVGRVAREKGIDDLLDAIPLVTAAAAARGVEVVCAVAGEGPHLEACRQRGLANVTFVGRLEGAMLAGFFASADVFAFPSTTDTFGNVLLEAMASGLPVVAAEAAPTLELLDGDARGVVHRGGDVAALADQLLALACDPHRRRALAANGLRFAQSRSWDVVWNELFRDYRAVAVAPAVAVAGEATRP